MKMRSYVLFDVQDMDVDSELNTLVEIRDSYGQEPYLIMSEMTLNLVRMLSRWYNDTDNSWVYSGDLMWVPNEFQIAIDRKIPFGEVKVK